MKGTRAILLFTAACGTLINAAPVAKAVPAPQNQQLQDKPLPKQPAPDPVQENKPQETTTQEIPPQQTQFPEQQSQESQPQENQSQENQSQENQSQETQTQVQESKEIEPQGREIPETVSATVQKRNLIQQRAIGAGGLPYLEEGAMGDGLMDFNHVENKFEGESDLGHDDAGDRADPEDTSFREDRVNEEVSPDAQDPFYDPSNPIVDVLPPVPIA